MVASGRLFETLYAVLGKGVDYAKQGNPSSRHCFETEPLIPDPFSEICIHCPFVTKCGPLVERSFGPLVSRRDARGH